MHDNNIRYSICGHQIVNLYDASGHKYSPHYVPNPYLGF